jgi:hypothetical protein
VAPALPALFVIHWTPSASLTQLQALVSIPGTFRFFFSISSFYFYLTARHVEGLLVRLAWPIPHVRR